ncbi:L,D-transpeptidase [Stenomitos frigidus ULC18]|uniref:L,D-transpeptidase n=2 Tax=Stenomitos TaxID=1844270 RepID=A0A2T1DW78_9CYAN|nr:L,D-transpeptidase [Stenomitos frigidus ULC18]
MAGMSIAATVFTVNTASSAQAIAPQPILQSTTLSNSSTRLEIHLSRGQAVLYQGDRPVKRYPIGTGRRGWETPVGTFKVMQMKRHPTWISPFTNERIAANDPRNPLGGYWIGFWTNGTNWIGFHGTLEAGTVGQATSHGCIHMYDSDLKDLFSQVSLGSQAGRTHTYLNNACMKN